MADHSYEELSDFVDSTSDPEDEPRQTTTRDEPRQTTTWDEPRQTSKRMRGKIREWYKVKEFESTSAAMEFVKSEATWSVNHTYDTTDGRKVVYQCRRAKRSRQRCPAAISDRETVSIFRTYDEHRHEERGTTGPTRGLSMNVRRAVEELFDEGVKTPTAILSAVRRRGLPEPSKIQLANYLQQYKKKMREGEHTVSSRRIQDTMNVGECGDWYHDQSGPSVSNYSPSEPMETMETNKEFIMACIQFIAFDLRPVNSISGEGFQKVIQAAIAVGATNGNTNAADIIPTRKIVTSKMRSLALEVRLTLRQIINSEINGGFCSLTTDTWSDERQEISYLSLTIHYIDSEWKLHERVLATRQFEREPSALHVRAEVLRCLREYGLNSLHNIVLVTRQEPNMVSAFRSDVRLNCISYAINKLLDNVLNQKPTIGSMCGSSSSPPIHAASFLQSCLDLVIYMKQSGLFNELDTSVGEVTSTRWISYLAMLVSIDTNYENIARVLRNAREDHRITFLNRDVMKILIQFLTPFKELAETMEATEKPTLHRVAPRIRSLLDILEPRISEPPFLIHLKTMSKAYLEGNFELHQLHGVALFLNPKMRSLKALDEESRGQTIDEVRAMLSEVDLRRPRLSTMRTYGATTNQAAVRPKTNWEEIWEDDGVEQGTTSSVDSEMELYKRLPVHMDPDMDLLQWWKCHAIQLPRLSSLARRILCIPSSSSSGESSNTAGLNITKMRARLNPKNVDDLLVLRSNFDLVK